MSLVTNPSSHIAEPEPLSHGMSTRLRQHGRGHQTTAKFQVEGPWNIGDPVHELITNVALQNAGLVPKGTPFNDQIVWEYLRGIFWNDDPEGFFFDNNETETDNWSSGVTFLTHFKSHANDATNGVVFGPGTPLLARSHLVIFNAFTPWLFAMENQLKQPATRFSVGWSFSIVWAMEQSRE